MYKNSLFLKIQIKLLTQFTINHIIHYHTF